MEHPVEPPVPYRLFFGGIDGDRFPETPSRTGGRRGRIAAGDLTPASRDPFSFDGSAR